MAAVDVLIYLALSGSQCSPGLSAHELDAARRKPQARGLADRRSSNTLNRISVHLLAEQPTLQLGSRFGNIIGRYGVLKPVLLAGAIDKQDCGFERPVH
jgi:hypothetical protein